MANTNKVKFGLSNVYYAVATIADDGSATYATPVRLPGAVNLSLEAQGENTPFYADNIAYWTSTGNAGYEGDFELALIPDSFKKDVLGYKEDASGILYEPAGAPTVNFALGGEPGAIYSATVTVSFGVGEETIPRATRVFTDRHLGGEVSFVGDLSVVPGTEVWCRIVVEAEGAVGRRRGRDERAALDGQRTHGVGHAQRDVLAGVGAG